MGKVYCALFCVALFSCGLLLPGPSWAEGLRSEFGKVSVDNLPPGIEYSMRRDAKFPLVVESKNDYPVTMKMEVLQPSKDELQAGYEAIPDISWIKLEKDSFVLEPKGKAETDVLITVPAGGEYAGRKFHVFIWAYTVGESLGFGIKCKLLLSVEPAKER